MITRILLSLIAFTGFTLSAFSASTIDFDRDIRPILSEYCFHCHGPDKNTREADLRLDTREGALADHDGMRAIIPKNAATSEIILRMLESDPDERMPPAKSKLTVKPEEIEKLKQWIDEGAEWAEHWAFQPIPSIIPPTDTTHPIDAFIQRRLKHERIKPSPRADKTTIIRRLTLDLTGLPPTIEDIDAFLNDKSTDAYETLVDRLMASPHYGERMAWPWLDAARYSDTDGFQGDPTRSMWPWRDWLVNALNHNMPFDQFTIEMLAGDLLPDATESQRLASGFNRNHTYNGEGGRIAEETRVENVFDRTETTSTVWMGLTMTCSRCHDHKYDPITQKEYFQLYAFFNNTSESGKGGRGKAPPIMAYNSPSQIEKVEQLEAQRQAIYTKQAQPDSALDAEQATWEKHQQLNQEQKVWAVLAPQKVDSAKGATFELLDDASFRAGGKNPDNDTYTWFGQTTATRLQSLRLETLLDKTQVVEGVGRDTNGNFVMTKFEIFARAKGQQTYQSLPIASAEADHTQNSFSINHTFDNNPKSNGWAVDGHVKREPRQAVFQLKEGFDSPEGIELKIVMEFNSRYKLHNLARGRFSLSSQAMDLKGAPPGIDPATQLILAVPAEKRTPEQVSKLRVAYRKFHATDKKYAQQKVDQINQQIKATRDSVPKVMVMDHLPPEKQRKTMILQVGAYDNPTDIEVHPNTPAWLPALPADAPRNRLTLARWLVSPENPLTARVTVNRYWQQFFGRGQVSTSEDFGSQGAKPVHPELLDWLAHQFVESGWDVKALHRLIVTSHAYRQSGKVQPDLLERDPDNLYLARAPRHRLPSWMLRDQALAVSGLLNPAMGGPAMRPYQPEGLWAEATFGKIKYRPDSDERIYRRSMYIFWRRIVGPPMFFDAAKRQACEVKPNRTNTPLHALTTLNETAFVEAARNMAQRVLAQPKDERITYAFRLATARQPTTIEQGYLSERLENFIRTFEQDTTAAQELLGVGNSPRNEKISPSEHAAWTLLCSTILNLDETLTR